jgi:hypothetical protein
MKQYIYLSVVLALFLFSSCSDGNNKEEFTEDKKAFFQSVELFGKTNDDGIKLLEDIKNGVITDSTIIIKRQNEYYKNNQEVIELNKKVSDKYLEFVHPQLKSMYRDNFITSIKLILENRYSSDREQALEVHKKINTLKNLFVVFVKEHAAEFDKELPIVPAKKSYWAMFWRLIGGDIIVSIIFCFLVVVLILPIIGIGKIMEKLTSKYITILYFPFIIIAGVLQAYFWILWAAFCAFIVRIYIDSPDVTYFWLYYLTGFFSVSAPLTLFSQMEVDTATSYKEQKRIMKSATAYIIVAIIAFIVFCVSPNLLEYKIISFFNNWIFPVA